MPSKLEQIAIAKTEPGDENNQDISALVGKTDIRQLEHYSQNDPDAYSFSGALCRTNQGLLEFVEMFKAPIKVLHPLLTATQEQNYMGTEAISAIPFNGIVLAHCFSEDTELLAIDGWKTHDQIEIDDLLATMNRETGKLEYQPAIKKFEQDYEGDMYHFLSHSMDHLVTPNHKMLYHTQYTNDWKDCTAEEYGETGKIIPVSSENNLPDYPISDDMLRLMVWVVADGSLACNRVRFHLKKSRKIDRLQSLLTQMDIAFDIKPSTVDTVRIHFDNNSRFTKFIPEYYNQLSARQGRIVLEEYAHTDGHRTKEQDYHYQLSSNVKANIDRLQHIAIASGCKANQCSHTKDRYSPQYFLSVRVGITETRTDYARQKTNYTGKVFCFETPNHTLVARRNGKVIVCSNSNEAEWQTFKSNRNNEAFIDRICVIKVPYCLRVAEEERIYRKMIDSSELKGAPCAPSTLEMIAQFSVLTRLLSHENSTPWSKMRVYNGENIKETDPRAKSVQEYRETAGVDEGMTGTSTRFSFKVLSATFNYDHDEVSADPVHLMLTLEKAIIREQLGKEIQTKYLDYIKGELAPRYSEFIGNEIQEAYLEAYDDYGQTLFDRYISYADHWMDDLDYKDPDTGTMFDREYLNAELEKIEKAAGIANPKDFRQETVKFVLRQRAREREVAWTSYEKLKKVIERKMFAQVESLLPVISFSTKSSSDDSKKHDEFVSRMCAKGYTRIQVRRAVEWWMRMMKSN
jgi:predicted Ser/Thr protein kinase